MSDKGEKEFEELSEEMKEEFEKLVGNYRESLSTIKLFINNNGLDFDETWDIIINQYLTKK